MTELWRALAVLTAIPLALSSATGRTSSETTSKFFESVFLRAGQSSAPPSKRHRVATSTLTEPSQAPHRMHQALGPVALLEYFGDSLTYWGKTFSLGHPWEEPTWGTIPTDKLLLGDLTPTSLRMACNPYMQTWNIENAYKGDLVKWAKENGIPGSLNTTKATLCRNFKAKGIFKGGNVWMPDADETMERYMCNSATDGDEDPASMMVPCGNGLTGPSAAVSRAHRSSTSCCSSSKCNCKSPAAANNNNYGIPSAAASTLDSPTPVSGASSLTSPGYNTTLAGGVATSIPPGKKRFDLRINAPTGVKRKVVMTRLSPGFSPLDTAVNLRPINGSDL